MNERERRIANTFISRLMQRMKLDNIPFPANDAYSTPIPKPSLVRDGKEIEDNLPPTPKDK